MVCLRSFAGENSVIDTNSEHNYTPEFMEPDAGISIKVFLLSLNPHYLQSWSVKAGWSDQIGNACRDPSGALKKQPSL
jgi:hypothetical protein